MGLSRLQTADLPKKPMEAHYNAVTWRLIDAGASVALGRCLKGMRVLTVSSSGGKTHRSWAMDSRLLAFDKESWPWARRQLGR